MEYEQQIIKDILENIISQVSDFYDLQMIYENQISTALNQNETIAFQFDNNQNPKQIFSESEWSSESDIDQNQVKYLKKQEETFFENADQVRTKNEGILQSDCNIAEQKPEREKRFGCLFQGDEELINVGKIVNIMDKEIIIDSKDHSIVLDLNTMLFTEDKEILGPIQDVFGNINNPHYLLLQDPYIQELICNKAIVQNTPIYMIKGYTKILLEQQIQYMKKQKGCDASNFYDEEACKPNEIEFSDDEMEAIFKQKTKQKNRKTENADLQTEMQDEYTQNDDIIKPKKPKAQKKRVMIVKNVNGVLEKSYVSEKAFEEMKNNQQVTISQIPMKNLIQQQNQNQVAQNQFQPQNQQKQYTTQGQQPNFHQNKRQKSNYSNYNNQQNNSTQFPKQSQQFQNNSPYQHKQQNPNYFNYQQTPQFHQFAQAQYQQQQYTTPPALNQQNQALQMNQQNQPYNINMNQMQQNQLQAQLQQQQLYIQLLAQKLAQEELKNSKKSQ